jgi:hypothetical protein
MLDIYSAFGILLVTWEKAFETGTNCIWTGLDYHSGHLGPDAGEQDYVWSLVFAGERHVIDDTTG